MGVKERREKKKLGKERPDYQNLKTLFFCEGQLSPTLVWEAKPNLDATLLRHVGRRFPICFDTRKETAHLHLFLFGRPRPILTDLPSGLINGLAEWKEEEEEEGEVNYQETMGRGRRIGDASVNQN